MKKSLPLTGILAFALSLVIPAARAQQPQATAAAAPASTVQSPMQKTVEAYLRNLYAFGADTIVKIGAPKDIGIEGLLEVDVAVKIGENEQTGKVYVTKDGKYMFRGEVSDLSKDPMVETRAQLETKDSPSLGSANAPVTLVEFSDFECPVCRALHDALRGMLPNYPQLRVVFKDFPLEQIHPWARTAALAGRCAYQQNPAAFWKMYDFIYDGQDLISPENAWGKMTDFASQSGLNADVFKACMASPEAGAAVDASRANGILLEVGSTPTMFVNGRRIVGADPHTLEQYIKYELDHLKVQKAASKN
ncbi:MAG TPA: thioredoxin domain-containing protein [Candidatus Acidoferrum sp.]|nr:thioredoxin domain-containing protein [Candidatus Acidoferrum sp.]